MCVCVLVGMCSYLQGVLSGVLCAGGMCCGIVLVSHFCYVPGVCCARCVSLCSECVLSDVCYILVCGVLVHAEY